MSSYYGLWRDKPSLFIFQVPKETQLLFIAHFVSELTTEYSCGGQSVAEMLQLMESLSGFVSFSVLSLKQETNGFIS